MSTNRDFSGKVVLVTGSSSGIGAEATIRFAKAGAYVVVTGRNVDRVSEVAKQCLKASPKGLKPLEVVADVSKVEECKRLIDSTIKTFGKLNILVNNAGIAAISSIKDAKILEDYNKVMDTNLRSVIYLTHLSVEHLEKTKGNIINISSYLGLKPMEGFTIYCVSKSALDMFTKCVALELGSKGIRVNAINPAGVITNISESMGLKTSEEDYKETGKSYPLGRIGVPEDIANAILFLASDESSFVTGINYVMDGGALNAPTPKIDWEKFKTNK